MHYVDAGVGPLVVLLHGFPEIWHAWRNQLEPLAEAGYHVMAPDLRGYELNALATNMPNLKEKVLIPGVGHWTQQEAPSKVNSTLISFLKYL